MSTASKTCGCTCGTCWGLCTRERRPWEEGRGIEREDQMLVSPREFAERFRDFLFAEGPVYGDDPIEDNADRLWRESVEGAVLRFVAELEEAQPTATKEGKEEEPCESCGAYYGDHDPDCEWYVEEWHATKEGER